MTDANHPSGTDRVHQAAELSGAEPDDVIVNVQGDEPDMPADVIRQVAHLCHATEVDIATVCEPLESSQVNDPNVVKVVRIIQKFTFHRIFLGHHNGCIVTKFEVLPTKLVVIGKRVRSDAKAVLPQQFKK